MLKAKTEQQQSRVRDILLRNGGRGVIEMTDSYVCIDGAVTFEAMADIVDYLRTPDDKDTELFEECWKAYRRKGIKKKAKDYWNKMKDDERQRVMPHISAYVKSRDVQYQKDFERYLRDRVFDTVVYNGNTIIYDPTKTSKDDESAVYMPICEGGLSWNDYFKCYLYIGNWDGRHIPDGYDDDNRPDGARVMLNNARGIIVWSALNKEWRKEV